jgi:hypothetical protein
MLFLQSLYIHFRILHPQFSNSFEPPNCHWFNIGSSLSDVSVLGGFVISNNEMRYINSQVETVDCAHILCVFGERCLQCELTRYAIPLEKTAESPETYAFLLRHRGTAYDCTSEWVRIGGNIERNGSGTQTVVHCPLSKTPVEGSVKSVLNSDPVASVAWRSRPGFQCWGNSELPAIRRVICASSYRSERSSEQSPSRSLYGIYSLICTTVWRILH